MAILGERVNNKFFFDRINMIYRIKIFLIPLIL